MALMALVCLAYRVYYLYYLPARDFNAHKIFQKTTYILFSKNKPE